MLPLRRFVRTADSMITRSFPTKREAWVPAELGHLESQSGPFFWGVKFFGWRIDGRAVRRYAGDDKLGDRTVLTLAKRQL